jgi:hypothetical protein
VPGARTVLIENAPGSGDAPVQGSGQSIRASLGLEPTTPVVLYTGTFEPYQGLDLLYAAATVVRRERPDVRFVLAGGKPEQVARARAQAAALGEDGIIFAGEQPADIIPSYLDAADVLVSPRSSGTNTPLKIYQYLRSGRPIVATRLLTHTQVLSDDVAILIEPNAESFGHGILKALDDPAAAACIGQAAKRLADRGTSDAYLQYARSVRRVGRVMENSPGSPAAADENGSGNFALQPQVRRSGRGESFDAKWLRADRQLLLQDQGACWPGSSATWPAFGFSTWQPEPDAQRWLSHDEAHV